MGLIITRDLVVKPQLQRADDPDVRKKTNLVILRSGLPPLSIDTKISNICSDQSLLKIMKWKPKVLAVATKREDKKLKGGVVHGSRLQGR